MRSHRLQGECSGDWGVPQQAILKVSAEAENLKNGECIYIYTACQFVKLSKRWLNLSKNANMILKCKINRN
jgi:hypothetical protein